MVLSIFQHPSPIPLPIICSFSSHFSIRQNQSGSRAAPSVRKLLCAATASRIQKMSTPKIHVNESIQAVNDKSWVIGGKLLLSHQPAPSATQVSWSDGKGGFFVLSDPPSPFPQLQPHPEDSTVLPLVYAAGDQSAVWSAGEAFIKIHDLRYQKATKEHVTLEFLKGKKPLGFHIPEVLYQGEWVDRYYLIISRVPGMTLTAAWPTMDEELRQYYVARVAEECEKMAEWKGEGTGICGVDGNNLLENYLAKTELIDPGELGKNAAAMGMNVSSLVFYHCDLGPGNVIVNPETRGLGIIDWEIAGYVPTEWVRTKFHVSSRMDFPNLEDGTEWRRLVARKLAAVGFAEVIDGFLAFRAM